MEKIHRYSVEIVPGNIENPIVASSPVTRSGRSVTMTQTESMKDHDLEYGNSITIYINIT